MTSQKQAFSFHLEGRYRIPAGLDSLVYRDNDKVSIPIEDLILSIYRSARNTEKRNEESISKCENLECRVLSDDIEWRETEHAPDWIKQQSRPGNFLSLRLQIQNSLSNESFNVTLTNQEYTPQNIDGEAEGYAGSLRLEVPEGNYTLSSALSKLRDEHRELTGRSAENLDRDELLAWIERESRESQRDNIEIPVMGIQLPISWFLTVVSFGCFSLALWSVFLIRAIQLQSLFQPSVPWMLLTWRWYFEERKSFLKAMYFILATSFQLVRMLTFCIPGYVLLVVTFQQDDILSGYLLPSFLNLIALYVFAFLTIILGMFASCLEYYIAKSIGLKSDKIMTNSSLPRLHSEQS